MCSEMPPLGGIWVLSKLQPDPPHILRLGGEWSKEGCKVWRSVQSIAGG